MLRMHPEASEEVEAALDWYSDRSKVAASAFLYEIEHGVKRIREAPARWPRFGGHARRYLLPSFPFSLIYRIERSDVLIVAVAHHRRRPGYWAGR